MDIFLYEFVTGGGCWSLGEAPSYLLLDQGLAMIQALAADFAAVPDIRVVTTRDCRLAEMHPAEFVVATISSCDEEQATIRRLAARADWTMLIAPETGGALLDRARLVEECGGRLISPSSACVEIAGSKQRTAELLARRGIPVPRGRLVNPESNLMPAHLSYPLVVKPDDSCGSERVCLLTGGGRESIPLVDFQDGEAFSGINSRPLLRVEEFVPGRAASVAVLCGASGNHPLPACEQVLSTDGRFTYLGGRLPLAAELNARAQRLALAAVAVLPNPRGYVGVDVILGVATDGSRDHVIEINPRLTTSYIGLRAAARTNLAGAILASAAGDQPDLSFGSEQLEFTADGMVIPVSCSLSPVSSPT